MPQAVPMIAIDPLGKQTHELRLPREAMSRTLERICQRLDNAATAMVPYRRWDNARIESVVAVIALWAVGSFARGSLDCGDLDLVIQFDVKERNKWPSTKAVNRVLLGKAPRVRLYCGVPDDNSSGVAFPEARLVWRAGEDWRALIASIDADPSAQRFARQLDLVPLRPEQLSVTHEYLEQLLAEEGQGVWQWRFVPIEAITPVPPCDIEDLQHRFYGFGKDAISCLSYLAGYFGGMDRLCRAYRGGSDRREVSHNGCRAVFGRPDVPVRFLDGLDVSGLVIFPLPTKRGPNGIWHIQRGPNHPLSKMFDGIHAWVIADGNQPTIAISNDYREPNLRCARLFLTERAVVDEIGQPNCSVSSGTQPLEIKNAEILGLVSQCDLVEVVGKTSMRFVNQMPVDDLISALKNKAKAGVRRQPLTELDRLLKKRLKALRAQ